MTSTSGIPKLAMRASARTAGNRQRSENRATVMKKTSVAVTVLVMLVLYSALARHEASLTAKLIGLTQQANGSTPVTSGTTNPASSSYKDGSYTGTVADAFYGNVQVAVTVSRGKITNVSFLQYPNTHATSVAINQQAMPLLQQEAIQNQSANVQIISGATFTSQAFTQSLTAALSQAKP